MTQPHQSISNSPNQFDPSKGIFSGHETFPVRYWWLKKGVDGIKRKSDLFTSEEAIVELGVGKNMVRAIRHWCLATKVMTEGDYIPQTRTRQLQLSNFGNWLMHEPGWDVFLEDDATLWLLHWNLATNPTRATTWYWAFNRFRDQEFSPDDMAESILQWTKSHNVNVAISSIKSDVSCFIRTYAAVTRGPASTGEETLECPLTNLRLISELPGQKRFRFNNGAKAGLPLHLFTYCLLEFWMLYHPNQETLNVREITHGIGSPGRIFRLDDDSILDYLDQLSELTDNNLFFNDTVLTRQVVRKGQVDQQRLLNDYYM